MAKLGIVSDEQFGSELSNCTAIPTTSSSPQSPPTVFGPTFKPSSTVISGTVVDKADRGRGVGSNEVPDGLRKLIAEEHLLNGSEAANELAQDFGVSKSSVSAYAKGATSTATYNKPNQNLQNYLTNRKNKASKKALRTLHATLDAITPAKLTDIKARDLAGIAKDMSVIAKNMEPENAKAGDNSKAQFIVYAPTIRDERTYETIVVNDNY